MGDHEIFKAEIEGVSKIDMAPRTYASRLAFPPVEGEGGFLLEPDTTTGKEIDTTEEE